MIGRRKSGGPSGLVAFVILVVASLVLFTAYVREDPQAGPLHTVQLGASEVLRPVHGVVGVIVWPFQSVSDLLGGTFGAADREAELREELLTYQERAADASRLAQENERLRQMLDGERSGYEYSPLAQVVAPVGGQFTDRVVINRGSADGIEPERPVIVGDNTLVGRTTDRITPNTAEILLITDQGFAAGVRAVPENALDRQSGEVAPPEEEDVSFGEGLLQTSWEGQLSMDYVELSDRVEQGDYVVTSGRAGDLELAFPPGLYLGTVESASSQDIDQFQQIVVSPAVNSDNLQEVRVIVGW